jgi:hypothetical protein
MQVQAAIYRQFFHHTNDLIHGVESQPGLGSTFYFILPAANSTAHIF